jgi:hypothetical protein
VNFLQCIQTAVDSGRLSEKKAAEVARAYEEAKTSAEAEGVTPDALDTTAALAALKATTQLKAAKRMQRLQEMRKAHEIHLEVQKTDKPWTTPDELMQRVADDFTTIQGEAMAGAGQIITTYMPQGGGLWTTVDNMDDIIHAIFQTPGKVVNDAARAMGKAATDTLEYLNQQLRHEGIFVPDNPHFRFPQTQDRDLIDGVNHGTKDENGVYKDNAWVEDSLIHNDWEIMRYHGKKIEPDQRRKVLSTTFDRIITDGDIDLRPAAPDNTTLAGRLSDNRFIYYKDADSYLHMQGKYGTGNFFHQFIEQIDAKSRDLALIRTFGPNPNAMRGFLERSMQKRSAELQLDKKLGAQKSKDEKARSLNRLDAQWDIYTRSVDTGMNNVWARWMNSARSISSSAVLGSVFISSLSDAAVGTWARQFYKMPSARLIPAYFRAMTNPKAVAKQMISDGILFESGITRAYENMKYMSAAEGHHIARLVSDFNYRISLAHLWTTGGKAIAGGDLERSLAAVRYMKFEEIPFSASMQALGITEKDWDLVRGMPLHEPEYYSFGKGEFLRPIDMMRSAATAAEREAAIKFRRFQTIFVRDAVPSPILRSQSFLGQHLPSTSLSGQLIKTANQLGLFTATVHFNHWKKMWNAPKQDRLSLMARWFAYTTASGAMITILKDVINGKEPAVERMVPGAKGSLDFWSRAMLNGGGGAIVGDLVYGLIQRNPYSGERPFEAQWRRMKTVAGETYDWATGEEDTKALSSSIAFVDGLIPKPWMVKLLWEREVSDRLLEETDPAAYARKISYQRKMAQENGQETFYGVGEHLIEL